MVKKGMAKNHSHAALLCLFITKKSRKNVGRQSLALA
jgi:hypothetical protein